MRLQEQILGKVSITVEEGYWNINKDYDKLVIVEKQGAFGTYISRIPVPAGIELTNRKYWIPFSSLKEEIVIDYAQFIAEYSAILDNLKSSFDNNQERLIALEKLKDLTTTLTQRAEAAIDNSKSTLKTANTAILKATEATDTAKIAINDAKIIQKNANDAVIIATEASNDAKLTSRKADTTLSKATEATNTANDALAKAKKAVENSEKAICVADKYYKLAQQLKVEINQTYADVLEQDKKIKVLYCNIVKLHDHVKEQLEIVNRDIGLINQSITLINSSIQEVLKQLEFQDKVLKKHKVRLDSHEELLQNHTEHLDNIDITNDNQEEHLTLHDERISNITERLDLHKDKLEYLKNTKVDKIEGKELSANDFTDALKEKLDNLFNYDDTELRTNLEKLTESFNTLVEGNPTDAIENFNEIIRFLEHISDSSSLEGIIAGIQSQIADIDFRIIALNNSTKLKFDEVNEHLKQIDSNTDNLGFQLDGLTSDLGQHISDNKTEFESINESIQDLKDNKVNKVEGKKLTTNDFTNTFKSKLTALPTASELQDSLDNKVNIEEGKGLSTENYTTEDKEKLAALPTRDELNAKVNSKVTIVKGKGLSTNDFTNEYKNKLDNLKDNIEFDIITEEELDAILI